MQESCDGQSGEEKALPENIKKRRLKTPSQVEALEKLYNEHKFPTELMKSQLAEDIGLSEKQVSGWLCHRRLKDKKLLRDEVCANGRQDFSSGVVQDRGSGLKQDSCSSTKQGEYRHFDPREVESQRFYGQNYPPADLTYVNRGQYMRTGNYSAMDNTSSGSSSASRERLFPQSEDPYDIEPLRYSSRSRNYMLMNTKGVKNREYMRASGHLQLQDEIENAAISAVKRQLGRDYQVDGPPLGIEFEPLPPGAFDSPIRDPIHEPYYVGDPILQSSHSVPRARKQPSIDTRYDKYNCQMHPQVTHPEGAYFKQTMWESDRQDEYSSYPSLQRSSFTSNGNHAPDRNSAMDNIDEDSAGEDSVFNNSRNYGMRSKHGVEGMRSDSITDHHLRPYGGEVITSVSYPRLHNYSNTRPHVGQRREYFESKPSNLILQRSESLDTEDRGQPRRIAKVPEEKIYREMRMSKEYGNPLRVKVQPKIQMRGGRIMRGDEFLPQGYVSKPPSPQALLPRTNQIKGSAGEMPTSFSEDETTASSSSMD